MTGVLIFALPIYTIWKLVASFRRKGVLHWPPILALSLWLLHRLPKRRKHPGLPEFRSHKTPTRSDSVRTRACH